MRDMKTSALQGYVTQAHVTCVGTPKHTMINILQTKQSIATISNIITLIGTISNAYFNVIYHILHISFLAALHHFFLTITKAANDENVFIMLD